MPHKGRVCLQSVPLTSLAVDKLAETKKQEAAMHEAIKSQQHQQKQAKEQLLHEQARQYKAEREYKLELDPQGKHSKRAIKEQRELLKHAEKAATGAMCEHGVQRCKICFPHRDEAKKHIEHERSPALGSPTEVDDDE
ncbi:hypothetical protein VOLCADRAFT_90663 [Volvox carteri f. nagariensis]|uniref:Uncharacterized protein n=1 Tax=Volvox carteri f. nagariensis TaxID=3068 RepID=D8TV03_VOLCA|nr:uncharacterized protein VOLCADRAFT_90663 [Volvox carteri f. nagariensis]EFJ48910.1 hypothetical protein VOLCADRAFT_90663 [Volvox carteri f. nagariensis]|eukprot:XP_002950242.1 hypothetical protein VOLCADRAFT_90663 [Volvox carteri f. nagariensis]